MWVNGWFALLLLLLQAQDDCWNRGLRTAGFMAAGSIPVGFFRAHATLKVLKPSPVTPSTSNGAVKHLQLTVLCLLCCRMQSNQHNRAYM